MSVKSYYSISIVILILQLCVALWIGSHLTSDARIPIHWNIHNQIDGYTDKMQGIYLFWGINVAIFLLMAFFRKYSPVYQRDREDSNNAIPLLTMGLVVFFALLHMYMLVLAMIPGWCSNVEVIFIIMGLLFMFIGNVMPKLSRNYFAGVKTPWTFYSDEIWRKTSRLSGFCFFLLGFVFLIGGLFNLKGVLLSTLLVTMLAITILVPTVYSFILYLKVKKEGEHK